MTRNVGRAQCAHTADPCNKAAYLLEKTGISLRRSRIDEILLAEGLRWRRHGSKHCFERVWRAGRSRVRGKKGRIETLYTAPPAGSVVVCLDEMGPLSARSYLGRDLVRPQPPPAGRARLSNDIRNPASGDTENPATRSY
jgi:hypothetical protein